MNKFIVKEITYPKEILPYLQLGINIPVVKEFYKYILSDLKQFQCISLVLENKGIIVGHVLLYHESKEELYFGFFGTRDHDPEKITFLISQIIEYGKQHSFKIIRGPLNIPTIIYGWGFMEEGSLEDLCRAKPVNPPIYPQLFLEHNFLIKSKLFTFEGPTPILNIHYNFRDYEIIHLNTWNDFFMYIEDFTSLNKQNMPLESTLTPNVDNLMNNYVKFEMDYGDPYLFTFVKHKKTNKIIGYIVCVPNPFRKNDEGFYDSLSFFSIVIDKQYQRKELGYLLVKMACDKGREHGIQHTTGSVESTNSRSCNLAHKMGLAHSRTHLILEYKV